MASRFINLYFKKPFNGTIDANNQTTLGSTGSLIFTVSVNDTNYIKMGNINSTSSITLPSDLLTSPTNNKTNLLLFEVSGVVLSANTFSDSSNLQMVDLYNMGNIFIPNSCFKNCSSLDTVIFPYLTTSGKVIDISANTFAGCSKLITLHFPSTNTNDLINTSAFDNITGRRIYLYDVSAGTNRTSYTSAFTSAKGNIFYGVTGASPYLIPNYTTFYSKVYNGNDFSYNSSFGSSTNAKTVTSGNTSVITVDTSTGNTNVKIINSGLTYIKANTFVTSLGNLWPSALSVVYIAKANTIISGTASYTKTYNDPTFSLNLTSTSAGAITYTSNNTNFFTVSGTTVTIVGVGTGTITGSVAETSNYNSNSQSISITVNQLTTTISGTTTYTKTYIDAPFTLNLTTNSGAPIVYTSNNPTIFTVSGSTVTIVGLGSGTITGSITGTTNYTSANQTINITVSAATTTLTITSNSVSQTYVKNLISNIATLAGVSTNISNPLIVYTSSNTNVATISNSNVIIGNVGSTTITGNVYGSLTQYYLSYTSTSSYANISDVNAYNYDLCTIECWVKTSSGYQPSQNGYTMFMGKVGSYILYMKADGRLGGFDYTLNADQFLSTSTQTVTDGNWHHIALSYQSGVKNGCVLYLDGGQIGTFTSTTNTAVTSTHAFHVSGDSAQGITGIIQICNARIWNIILTPTQIGANRYNTITGATTGLVGSYVMNQTTGTTITNMVDGTTNNATIYGSYQWLNTTAPTFTDSVNYISSSNTFTLTVNIAQATITVTTPNTLSATLTNAIYTYYQISATTNNTDISINYVSSNPYIAQVDQTGNVYILAPGTATITLSTPQTTNFYASTPVNVTINSAPLPTYGTPTITGYNISGTSLNTYFPSYEIKNITISSFSNNTYNDSTITLSRTVDTVSNYSVYVSLRCQNGDSNSTASKSAIAKNYIVYGRTTTNFKFYIKNSSGGTFTNFSIDLFILYTFTESVYATNINNYYKDNTTDMDTIFPQYISNIVSNSITTNNYGKDVSISAKNIPGTATISIYSDCISNYDASTSAATLDTLISNIYPIMNNLVLPATSASFSSYATYAYFSNVSIVNTNADIHTVAFTIPTSSSNTYTSNYSFNSILFNNYYPICEFFDNNVGGGADVVITNTLVKNPNSNTNYIVLMSHHYDLPGGSGGTYNAYEASNGVNPPIITAKSSTSFTYLVKKGTGNNWNGGVYCMVIYYT